MDQLYKKIRELYENEKAAGPIRYLPGIYHEEAEKKFSPFWALLHVVEHTFDSIEEKLDRIETYFDIRETPAEEFLPWLTSWIGLEPEQDWSEQKKRFALKIAADLYKRRGTPAGLVYMVSFYFDIEVEIEEWVWPRAMQVGVHNTIGVNTRLHGRPNKHHCFALTWKVPRDQNNTDLPYKIRRIRALIDREKPAHTECFFIVKRPVNSKPNAISMG